jgi:hypothetical protein
MRLGAEITADDVPSLGLRHFDSFYASLQKVDATPVK